MLIRARDIGVDADRAIRSGGAGEVAAVFERSAYVRFASGWTCLGNAEIGSGPLNVPCSTPPRLDWRAIARTGAPARLRGGTLRLGEGCSIRLAEAAIWRPPGFARVDPRRVMMALESIGDLLPQVLPHGGLAGLLDAGRSRESLVLRAARPAVAAFEAWLLNARGTPESALDRSVRVLLGLGPGLTPSGDDFLAGAMATLRGFGHEDLAGEVWKSIETAGSEATTAVSHAHLRAAARGALGEDLHGLLGAILAGRSLALLPGMRAMKARENHSPWDCLSGIYVTSRALCRRSGSEESPARWSPAGA